MPKAEEVLMGIAGFAADLVRALERRALPRQLVQQQDLEQQFVLPVAARLAAQHRGVLLVAHPWSNTRRCAPSCASAPPAGRGRVLGCPACWRISGAWASLAAFGAQHVFDLLATDGKKSLAVAIELSRARGGRLPGRDVQRFIGQCAVAATRHPQIVGVFVYQGTLAPRWQRDTAKVAKSLKKQNIHLIFRSAWSPRLARESLPLLLASRSEPPGRSAR
jgi:hypothetical protein